MCRRLPLLLFGWLALLGSCSVFGAPPNILFIAVDDLRPEIGAYGARSETPNIDRLVATGTKFGRAYCQQAVCGASRLSIMGGLYPTMTKEQTFHISDWRQRHPNLLTINQHFGNHGYKTIGLGKVYHGIEGPGVDLPNWDRWITVKAPIYATPQSIQAREEFRASRDNEQGRNRAKGPMTERADVPDDAYSDGKRARTAVELLRSLTLEDKRPFFFAVGFTKPHLPFTAPEKYWDLHRESEFSMPGNSGIPPGYPAYAANLRAGEMRNYSDFQGRLPTDFSNEFNRRLLHGYAACVSYTDTNIGMVLDALEATDLSSNTIVVMWSDHGWKLGDHSTWCKHTNFECDTRVPLVMRVQVAQTARRFHSWLS